MTRLTLILMVLGCALFVQAQVCNANTSTKAESIAVVLKALNKVYELSGQPATAQNQRRFDQLFGPYLRTIHKADELAKLSIICFHLASPGSIEDEYVDVYFDRCFLHAAGLLAETKGQAAQDALQNIKRVLPLDASGSLDINGFIEAQKSLR